MNRNTNLQQQVRAIPVGKTILCTVASLTAVGGFLADWNRTHLFNPDWPPHAKFHDAWTISLGILLGGTGLYLLLRDSGQPAYDTAIGTLLPAFFWASQGASFLYPGAKGLEAEFPRLVPRFKGIPLNELPASMLMLTLTGTGYALENRRRKSEL